MGMTMIKRCCITAATGTNSAATQDHFHNSQVHLLPIHRRCASAAAACAQVFSALAVKSVKNSIREAPKRRPLTTAVSTPSLDLSTRPLSQKFRDLKKLGKVALIAYITAGDPDIGTTEEALRILDTSGADIIEIGVPYSDPLADGPVIQSAATRALKRGTTLDSVLEMLKRVVPSLSSPIVLFSYYNMILKRGPASFSTALKEAGVSGIVVPDVPLEETDNIRHHTSENGIELVLLTTPTTPPARMEAIAKASQGFVYLVSLTGVTGARPLVDRRVEDLLKDLKKLTQSPIAVGFGISKPEHAAQVARWGADGVIVGSAIVKLLGEGSSPKDGIDAMKRLIIDLKAALP